MTHDNNKSVFVTWLAALIVLTALALAIGSLWKDSISVDEIPHVGAGYSYLAKNDMRLNPEHPPLAKDLAGLPLYFLKLSPAAFNTSSWNEDINGQWQFGRQLIFNSGNDAVVIAHLTKIFMLAFFVLSAHFVFRWTRKLYGDNTALLALTLFSFSPTVMAHSRLVTTDVAALFGVLYSSFYFLVYLKNPKFSTFILAAFTFGVALLTKFSTVLLIPYLVIVALTWGWIHGDKIKFRIAGAVDYGLRAVLVFIVGFVIVVWPIYYIHVRNYPADRQHRDTESILSSIDKPSLSKPVIWASDKPYIRAAAQYGLGLLMVGQRSISGNDIFYRGKVINEGGPSYFPFVYFIKEPLAWWALVVIALCCVGIHLKRKSAEGAGVSHWLKKYFDEYAMLVWLVIYWAISIESTLNIGVRHLLPAFPFMIILVSGQIMKFKTYTKDRISHGHAFRFVMPTVIVALLGWYIFENISIYPHYLAYFNQVAGGPAGGYKYVDDSNLDWGQELVRFSDWVKENNIKKIGFDYFGWADPSYFLGNRYEYVNSTKYKDADDFMKRNDTDGWIAVSYTFLNRAGGLSDSPRYPNYDWLKAREPITIIGYSIYVYRIQ